MSMNEEVINYKRVEQEVEQEQETTISVVWSGSIRVYLHPLHTLYYYY